MSTMLPGVPDQRSAAQAVWIRVQASRSSVSDVA
jgi:hypothetical protein